MQTWSPTWARLSQSLRNMLSGKKNKKTSLGNPEEEVVAEEEVEVEKEVVVEEGEVVEVVVEVEEEVDQVEGVDQVEEVEVCHPGPSLQLLETFFKLLRRLLQITWQPLTKSLQMLAGGRKGKF